MKYWLLLGIFGLALNVNAADVQLTCKSATSEGHDAKVTFGWGDVVTSVEVDGQTVWTLNRATEDVYYQSIAIEATDELQILPTLARLANPTKQPADWASISIVLSKREKERHLDELLSAVADDGAGMVYLQLTDADANSIGNALFAGWAGLYHDCK